MKHFSEKFVVVFVTTVIILGMAIYCFAQEQVRVVAFYPIPFGAYNMLFSDIYLDTDQYATDITQPAARFFNPAAVSAFENFVAGNSIHTSIIYGTRNDDIRNKNIADNLIAGPRKVNYINLMANSRSQLEKLDLLGALDVMDRIYLMGDEPTGTDSGTGPSTTFPTVTTPGARVWEKHVFDLAEGIKCLNAQAGDIVSADVNNPDTAVACSRPYDARILGVISANPRVALGVTAEKKPVCLRGKIYCNATTLNGPIKRGDIMVSSPKKGFCMRADLKKVKPGMIVGKALQNLDKDEGKILILVNVN